MSNPNPKRENLELGKWKPGQSGNPKGRPKKLVSQVLSDLKDQGYSNITAPQVKDIYEQMLSLPREALVSLGSDEEQPMVFRIIARAMLSTKGFDIIEKMIDRAQGKPQQAVDITTGGDQLKVALVEFVGSDGTDKDPDKVS